MKNQKRIDGHFKGISTSNNQSMFRVAELLRRAAGERGFMGNITRSQAQKKIQELERAIKKHHANEEWGERDVLMRELDELYKNGEASAFSDFWELASSGNTWMNKQNKYGRGIVSAVEIWRNEMKPNLDKSVKEGMDAFYYSCLNIKGESRNTKYFQDSLEKIKVIRKAVHDYVGSKKLKSDFPVQLLDIAPTLGKVYDKYTVEGKNNPESYKEANTLLGTLIKEVLDTNLSVATKLYSSEGKSNISKNVLPIMDAYVRSVSRFKLAAESNLNMLDAVQKITAKQSNSDRQTAQELETFIDYIKDRYQRGSQSVVGDEILRTLTNAQAMYNLGLPNFRSPTKNVAQSFQHFTWWGWQGLKRTRNALKDPKMRIRIESNLKDNAILFQNIAEVYEGAEPTIVKDPRTGLYHEKIDQSFFDSIAKSIQKATEILLLPMTTVENMWNRKGSQQHGIVEKWEADNLDPTLTDAFQGYILGKARRNDIKELQNKDGESVLPYKKSFSKRDYKEWSSDVIKRLMKNRTHTVWEGEAPLTDYDYYMEFWRRKRAGDHADLITEIIHFDYSKGGKPKIMKKEGAIGPLGALGGQFRTWWANNVNYRKNIAKEGVDDIFSGLYGGEHAWRLYRMGMQNILSAAIIGPLLNINLSGLIDNTSWWNAASLSMDTLDAASYELQGKKVPKEVKDKILKATYGGGLVGGAAGVHFNAAVRAGSLIGMERLDQKDNYSYIWGMEQWGDLTKDERVKEYVATAHVGLGRLVTEHIPAIVGGAGISYVTENELGLKPTKTQKAIRQFILQKAGIRKEDVSRTLTKPSRKQKYVSPYNIEQIEILQDMMAQIPQGGGKKADYTSPAGLKASLDALLG